MSFLCGEWRFCGICAAHADFARSGLARFFCRLVQTYEAHSGYCIQDTEVMGLRVNPSLWLGGYPYGAAVHDFHHTRNAGNYGSDFLDYVFGTMDVWVAEGGLRGYLEGQRAKARRA